MYQLINFNTIVFFVQGGIKAVVWTDVFQVVMIFVGMSAIVAKGISKAGGLFSAFEIAGNSGRLELLK